MEYRLIIVGGFIIAQRFCLHWYTLSKSSTAGVDGLAIWPDTAANRKRAVALFNGAPYRTVEASRLWEAHRTPQGWRACNGEDYLPEVFSVAKDAVLALAKAIA